MPIEAVKIPQNVYVEDRIVGPVTLRQLIILIVTGGLSYAIMTAARNQMGETSIPVTILCWTPFMIGLVFSFVKIQGIGITRFILLMVEKMQKPSVRTWTPRRGISINFQYFSHIQEDDKKKKQVVMQPHRERLEELSALLDQGPLVQKPAESVQSAPRPVDPSRVTAETSGESPLLDDVLPPRESEPAPAAPPNGTLLQDILPPSAHA